MCRGAAVQISQASKDERLDGKEDDGACIPSPPLLNSAKDEQLEEDKFEGTSVLQISLRQFPIVIGSTLFMDLPFFTRVALIDGPKQAED